MFNINLLSNKDYFFEIVQNYKFNYLKYFEIIKNTVILILINLILPIL